MQTSTPQFCKDCKHHRDYDNGYFCEHPVLGRNLVTGEPNSKQCFALRAPLLGRDRWPNRCGEEGKFFEAIEAAAPTPPCATTDDANQALLNSIRRLSAGEHLVGDQICVFGATLGIDTLPVGSTPSGESVRVYVYTDNPDTFCLVGLAAYLGIPEPLIKGAMEFVTVLKHGQQPGEVLALVPSHSDGLNLLTHEFPRVVETAIVME